MAVTFRAPHRGVEQDDMQPAFDSAWVERLFEKPRFNMEPVGWIDKLIVTIDPNAGGNSQFAIVTCYFTSEFDVVIIGLVSQPCGTPRARRTCVYEHLNELHRLYPNTRLVVATECNLGAEAHHMAEYVEGNRSQWANQAFVLRADGSSEDRQPGIRMTDGVKEEIYMHAEMSLQCNKVHLARRLVTTGVKDEAGQEQLLDEFKRQLTEYFVITKDAADEFGRIRRRFTGKVGGRQDDVSVAFQLCYLAEKAYEAAMKPSRARAARNAMMGGAGAAAAAIGRRR